MKKKVIITGLMAIIISCGGGGGSGSPTNQPTPHNGNSSNSTQNTEKNTTNTENINNIPNASNPKKDNTEENNSNKGIGHNDNSGKKDENRNQFPKPENIDGKLMATGGRVLVCVGIGKSIKEARDRAYALCGQVHFAGKKCRTDIAYQALK